MRYAISLLPVLAFLTGLVLLDNFRLVRARVIGVAMVAGGVATLFAFALHLAVERSTPSPLTDYSVNIGPVVEESLKAAYVTFLIRARRIGFLIDAAIYGFAVGAGFAVVENLFFLQVTESADPMVWVLRGFGTAAMHGNATALFGIVTCRRTETRDPLRPIVWLPGLALAITLHVIYNHVVMYPLVASTLIVVVVPLIMVLIFRHNERSLRRWLAVGFDTDAELLLMLSSGNFTATRVGQYLSSFKSVLPTETVVDLLCLLRIHVELSLLAKGALMMRKAGYNVPVRPELAEQFAELAHLKQSIGRVGWIALRPLLSRNHQELWQLTVLAER